MVGPLALSFTALIAALTLDISRLDNSENGDILELEMVGDLAVLVDNDKTLELGPESLTRGLLSLFWNSLLL